MKALALCLIVTLLAWPGTQCVVMSQTTPGSATSSPDPPPAEVCKAIETYIAKIDAASSPTDPDKRARLYEEAKAELEPVLTRNNRASLLSVALSYQSYSELVIKKDATDRGLSDLLEKKLKVRAELLELCSTYTTSR